MAPQLHKRFSDEQIKSLLERYLSKDIGINYLLEILGIKRSRFFELLKAYRDDPHRLLYLLSELSANAF